MTYAYHVGEPATTRPGGRGLPRASASVGPGGVQILLAVESSDAATERAVESGRIALGMSDGPDHGAILVQVGAPGRSGYLEASATVEVGRTWWGGDVELGLCDRDGVVRAVRRFSGLEAPGDPADDAGRLPDGARAPGPGGELGACAGAGRGSGPHPGARRPPRGTCRPGPSARTA